MSTNEITTELEIEQPDPNESDEELVDPLEPFNPKDIDIVVEPKSLDILIERIKFDEIDMYTDFQRHADLWDNVKMSRLIESVLIRFPLPPFYFDASDDKKWLIVDGLQRLSAIRKFLIDKKLRLTGLEFLTDLNGQGYDKLHRDYQRRIKECPVTVYLIKPGTPANVKYSVFRRINTGGITLNNQEIRNAMAKPEDRKLLERLAKHPSMLATMGDLSKRMMDQELVLRFWAFYRFDYLEPKNKKAIALFLDKAMDEFKWSDSEYRVEFEKTFDKAITRCHRLLGETAFEKQQAEESRRRRKNSTLFEVWMVTLAKLSEADFESLETNKDFFKEELTKLLQDNDFISAITFATQKELHVRIRYDKLNQFLEWMLQVCRLCSMLGEKGFATQ